MARIALITSHAPALVDFRGSLIEELVGRGHQVMALAPNHDEESRQALLRMGSIPVDYRLSRTGMNPFRDLLDLLALRRVLLQVRPEAVLCFFAKPVIYGMMAARLAKVPHRVAMIEGLGYAFTESNSGRGGKKRLLRSVVSFLYRLGLRQAKTVIFLNPDDVDEFLSRGLVSRCKVVLLGGIGVDLAAWPQSPVPADPVTFLMVGRILREKGVHEFVEAARIVKRCHPEVSFVLAGGLDANPSAIPRAQVQSWVDAELIQWPGHVPVLPWLIRASVFVLPSYREGVPRSTQEALAVGRPVITTDVPGCRETVEHGRNGYLVPARDPKALAGAMIALIDHPDKLQTMGRRSRNFAEERFDEHKANAKLLQILVPARGSQEEGAA